MVSNRAVYRTRVFLFLGSFCSVFLYDFNRYGLCENSTYAIDDSTSNKTYRGIASTSYPTYKIIRQPPRSVPLNIKSSSSTTDPVVLLAIRPLSATSLLLVVYRAMACKRAINTHLERTRGKSLMS